jgi:hypothetical protein
MSEKTTKTLLESWDVNLERWRFQSILGIRKIVWFYCVICVLLTLPTGIIGQVLANVLTPRVSNILVQTKQISHPVFTIEPDDAVQYEGNKRGFFATVSNQSSTVNTGIGYSRWVYRFALYDINGKALITGRNTSFLLPEDTTYIVGPVTDEQGLKFEINTVKEASTPVEFALATSNLVEIPRVFVTNTVKPETSVDNPNTVQIKFSIENTSVYNIKETECIFIIRDRDSKIIGIGRYITENLASKEIREVNLQYPKPTLGNSDQLEVKTSINYLDPENLVLQI